MESCAFAQEVGSRVPESAEGAGAAAPGAVESGGPAEEPAKPGAEPSPPMSLLDRFRRTFSQQEDPDGPINTDRPTFTPANTVVPRGRLQFESGWTFNSEWTSRTRDYLYDFPELAVRYGLADRVEFRMFWLGQTFAQARARRGGPWRSIDGPSDMEVGFKWQLFPGDEKRKWIPTTALITSIYAPTGGTSPYSSETVEPYINLIYGWSLTKELTLAGSTGYLGIREQAVPNSLPRSDNFQRWHQSIVAFYTATERTTLFYEWYVLMYTHSPDNRPDHFMDGGIIYRLAPNIQVDIRAGFGLSGRPDDFFTGTGFSIRF
jgi:Putative MetA-pathway of phenol degradation